MLFVSSDFVAPTRATDCSEKSLGIPGRLPQSSASARDAGSAFRVFHRPVLRETVQRKEDIRKLSAIEINLRWVGTACMSVYQRGKWYMVLMAVRMRRHSR
jgi:hypothetical protein